MSSLRIRWGLGPLAFVLCLEAAARAQTTPPSLSSPAPAPPSEADRLIDRGLDLRGAGKDKEALPLFERAYELAPTPRAAAQRGFVLQALGQWARAETDLIRARSNPEDPWIRGHRALIDESLAFVQAHLGSLLVEVNVRDAEVMVDGAPAGRTPLPAPLRLPPGPHTVEVRARGFQPTTRDAVVAAQQTARMTVALAPASAPALIPPAAMVVPPTGSNTVDLATTNATPSPAPFYRRWYFWAGIAAVAATAITIAVVATPSSPACGDAGRICAR